MKDPQRLLDSPSLGAEARAMLKAYPKTPSLPPQLELRLAAQIESMPPPSSRLLLLKGGAVAVLLIVAGALLWPLEDRQEPLVAEPSTAELRPLRQTRFVALPAPQLEGMKTTTSENRRVPANPKSTNSLAEELKILDEARAKLEASPQLAIKQVKLHARRYPNGQLVDLRDYLEIRIYEQQGDVARSRRLRDQFFSRHADSAFIRELQNDD